MSEVAARPRLWWTPSELQRTVMAVLLVGVACGLLALGFQTALLLAERALIQRAQHAPGGWWPLLTLLCPTLGGLIAGVLSSIGFASARGSGLPQVKAAFTRPQGTVPLRDGAARFLLSTLQIGSGASLGAQGPTVHMCAALSATLGRWLALSPTTVRQLLPVGAAAGMAATFSAPLAAVAFVLESIVGKLQPRLLPALVPAAVLAAAVGHVLPGAQPRVGQALSAGLPSWHVLPAHALLGVIAGLVSAGFQRNVLRLRAVFHREGALPGWARPALGGFATGSCALLGLSCVHSGGVAGLGYAQLSLALQGALPLATLLVLGVLKFGATCFSFASGGSGGVFAPALFIGAMLGGALGGLGQPLLGADQLHACTLVGMAACFAGMLRAPLTSVLIVCELTGSLALLGPLAVASGCAYLVARRCARLSLYDSLLAAEAARSAERAG